LVGKVLANQRAARNFDQAAVAAALGISQSAYSRIERGETPISVFQLSRASRCLGMRPGEILARADGWADQLVGQGVQIADEWKVTPSAIMIGLGVLAALLAATK
jgi:transcriptional regulator with XRE-family HTH domain